VTELTVKLEKPASEAAQEEIRKQVPFLSSCIRSVSFSADGAAIVCELSREPDGRLTAEI
jgi:hypothetical protein